MRLEFTLDPEIIHHIIHSQAGSIGKAIIELIMNSVDAQARLLRLTLDADGFVARDDGNGFASREDVIRYFGRFGTPHQEGDATFGRFRLGRGQIMAHAATVWRSQAWQMTVDTRTMGYAYDLDDLAEPVGGCEVTGRWYDRLDDMDLYEVLQELRDLVRYTPLQVELNGKVITRDPALEVWDHQDDLAYYRFRREGAVAIYNQGVLVRHDAGQIWGAGGLIVTKKAIALNVSRTEILRKTCPTWQAIATEGKRLAKVYAEDASARQGENGRALAARRIKVAQGAELLRLLDKEAVITLLPGTRHVSIGRLPRSEPHHRRMAAVPPWVSNLAHAEMLAMGRAALMIHPRTLERFECADAQEFEELWADIRARVEAAEGGPLSYRMAAHTFVPYETLLKTFKAHTEVVADKALPIEVRRAWTALRWCLRQYCAVVLNGGAVRRSQSGRVADWHGGVRTFNVLAGRSSVAEAWTDGQSYLAFDIERIKALSGDGLRAAQRLFALADHELAHEGDSLDATHDEAFYTRYHDISMDYAADKQRYLSAWLRKYALSLEGGRSKPFGWARYHLKSTQTIVHAEGDSSGLTEDVGLPTEADLTEATPSSAVLAFVNATLHQRMPVPVVDEATLEALREGQVHRDPEQEEARTAEEEAAWAAEAADRAAWEAEWEAEQAVLLEESQREEAQMQAHLQQVATTVLGRSLTEDEVGRLARAGEPLVGFLQQQGRLPLQEAGFRGRPMEERELDLWDYLDRPRLAPEQNLLALARLARGAGRGLKEYLQDVLAPDAWAAMQPAPG
jgi:hypothetical protein